MEKPRNLVHVDFFTDTHRITCQVEAGSAGLLSLLNDAHNSIFTVRNAFYSRLKQPTKIVASFDEAYLTKASLAFGLLTRREDVGAQGYARTTGGGKILSIPVLMTTRWFEIKGIYETITRLDPEAVLVGGQSRFTVLYDTAIVAIEFSEQPAYTSIAMLINRHFVTSLAAMSKGKA